MEHKTCATLNVTENRPLGGGEQYLLTLEDPSWAKWRPGQFVMVRPVSWGPELTWARPVSIAHVDGQGLRLMIRPAGRGTGRMAKLAPGDEVFVWGPLGTGFVTEPDTPTLLLAGGIGLAPFWGYAARHPKPRNLRLVLGHTIDLSAFPLDLFTGLTADKESDKGIDTFHQKTMADLDAFIALLGDRIAAHGRDVNGLVLACGPAPFLRTVRKLADQVGARCQLSLENRMACGIGACLGCVTKDAAGHNVQSCTRGPVFWTHDLAETF